MLKREIWKRTILSFIIALLFMAQSVSAENYSQVEIGNSLDELQLEATGLYNQSESILVYKSNGNYYTVNTMGNTSYAKINRNVDFYIKIVPFDIEMVVGSSLKTYVINETSGSCITNIFHLSRENGSYSYDASDAFDGWYYDAEWEQDSLYIPISDVLKNQQGSVRLYYDFMLLNNTVVACDTSSTNGFYVSLLGEYSVSYNANGGTGAPASQTKYSESALTLSSTIPVRTGYTFKGWSPSSTEISRLYQPGDSYSSNGDVTLYAVWELNLSAPIVVSPTAKSVKEGESATFTVSVSGGNPSNYTYQWYYSESSTGTGTQISGATSSSYTITSSNMISSLDGRYYYCVVSDGQYDVPSGRAKLTVQSDEISETNVPLTVSGLTECYTIASGTSLDLEVSASGGSPDVYTYQWYYAESESGEGTKIDGAVSSKYTIPSLEVTVSINGRYYYCIVSNGAYYVESQRTRVFVYNETDQEPETGEDQNTETGGNKTPLSSNLVTQVIQASSYTKEYGSKAFFIQASTNGNGKLTYQSSDKKVATVSSKGKVTLKGYGTAVVTIHASKTSAYKAVSKQITIKVIPKKTALKKVNSPGRRRIRLKWEKNENIIGYEIYISTSKNFKTHTLKRTYPKSKTSIAITRLKSGKKYYVKIRSYTKVGNKKYKSNWSKTKQVKVK